MPTGRSKGKSLAGSIAATGAVVNGWSFGETRWARVSEKVALSLRDRWRDQQWTLIGRTVQTSYDAARAFALPVAERQGYHPLTTAPRRDGESR